MLKLKKSEERKIARKEKEWGEIARPIDKFSSAIKKEFRRDYKAVMNFMMYYKKPKDRIDRWIHGFVWWLIIGGVFFAMKGLTDFLTGK